MPTTRSETDPFFDRTEESALIDEVVALLGTRQARLVVLEVAGVGGVGKTRFLRQTVDRLAARSDPPTLVWVDLDEEAAAKSIGPLTAIRNQLTFDCPLFDTGVLRYWTGMDRHELPDHPVGSSSAWSIAERAMGWDALDLLPADFAAQVFAEMPPGTALRLGYEPGEFSWIDQRRAQPNELHPRLPILLGTDIARRMRNPAVRRVVVCYDGYDKQSAATVTAHAPWLRHLLTTVDAGVHLIATRERLGWDDPALRDRTQSITLGELPEAECRKMIRRALGDLDRDVEDRLIWASGKVAFRVRALINGCRPEMHRRGQVRIAQLPSTPPAVVEHFLDHLDESDRTLAQSLAAVQYFDESLYRHLVRRADLPSTALDMNDFVEWFFVTDVSGGLYKTHDLLTAAVRQSARVDRHAVETLRHAVQNLDVRTRELPQTGADRLPQLYHALVEGWQAMDDVPPADSELLIDIGYHLYDSGYWRGLKQLPGQSLRSGQPASVIARYFAALAARRVDGIARAMELLAPLEPQRLVLGRHAASFDIERAYLRELGGDYAYARAEFRRLNDEANPFDPTRRDHVRARLYHADMLIMDGGFDEANELLADAHDQLDTSSLLDRAEFMRHRGHAYRFSLDFPAAEARYAQGLEEASESPSMTAKFRTNLAESRCWHKPDRAVGDAQLAIDLNTRLGSRIEVAKAQAALAVALARQRRPDLAEARNACDLALAISHEITYPAGACFALQALVVVEVTSGDLAAAADVDAELRHPAAATGHLWPPLGVGGVVARRR